MPNKAKHKPNSIAVVCFDFQAFLKALTGTSGWKEIQGPDSGVGLDYWYRAGKHEANINLDQGHLTVSVDQDVVFEGNAEAAQCKENRDEDA